MMSRFSIVQAEVAQRGIDALGGMLAGVWRSQAGGNEQLLA